jgi:acyl transferase domain-containing protein
VNARSPQIALTYPGQGAYSPGLLHRLDVTYPEVAPELSRLRATWLDETGEDLDHVTNDRDGDVDQVGNGSLGLSQAAIFAASLVMNRVVRERLGEQVVHMGHSFGEVAALTCAGAWSPEDGARVVAARVRALRSVQDDGGMTAIACDAARAASLVDAVGSEALVLAGHNGPGQAIASGPLSDLARLEEAAAVLGIGAVRLKAPYAFHSPMMRPAAAAFEQAVRAIGWRPLTQPAYSPILGRLYRDDDDLAALVASHLTDPFDFGAAVRTLHHHGTSVFVECGGRSALSAAVRRTLGDGGSSAWRAVAGDDGSGQPLAEALRAVDGTAVQTAPALSVVSQQYDVTALAMTLRDLLRADIETTIRQLLAEVPRAVRDAEPSIAEPPPTAPQPPVLVPAAAPADAPAAPAALDRPAVLEGLVQLYAEALEYPPEVLEEQIELEADLGVDSVKQTELLARVADRFGLPPQPSGFVIGEFPTLGHIADLVLDAA